MHRYSKCRCGVGRADKPAGAKKTVGDGDASERGYIYDADSPSSATSRFPHRPMSMCFYDGVDVEQTWHDVEWDNWRHGGAMKFDCKLTQSA